MYIQYNGEKDCMKIPLAKNCKIQQVAYKQVDEKIGPYNQRGGGKFGADNLLYDGDPDQCHAKYLGYKKLNELIGSNRLAEKTDKQVMLINKFIKKKNIAKLKEIDISF
ncbi:hypothetical protein pb186bvf_006207 [Paramecium bursaria]